MDTAIEELKAQQRLAQVMNDTPVELTVAGERLRVRALRPAVASLIAEEACKIATADKENMGDIIRKFAACSPAVVRCLALALLNDKDKIYSDYRNREFSDEYRQMCEKLEWESDHREWIGALIGVIGLLDMDFFFRITQMLDTMRMMMTAKKTETTK